MEKFEYRIEWDEEARRQGKEIMDVLNTLGAEGWEAFSVVHQTLNHCFYLKRKIG